MIFSIVVASCGGEAEYETVQLRDMGCLPLAEHGDRRLEKIEKKMAKEIEQNCRPCRELQDISNRFNKKKVVRLRRWTWYVACVRDQPRMAFSVVPAKSEGGGRQRR